MTDIVDVRIVTVHPERVGPSGRLVWFAYINGEILRDKRGVGRRFKTKWKAFQATTQPDRPSGYSEKGIE